MIFTNQQRRFIQRFLLLLVSYSLIRIGFYFYQLQVYKFFLPSEIFDSFFIGIRFDIAAICLLNIPVILLTLIPSTNSKFLFFERVLFVSLNSCGILASLVDYELFLFMGKRLSSDLFVILDDIWDQLPQLALNFWYFPFVAIVFAVGFYFLDKKMLDLKSQKIKKLRLAPSSLLFMGIVFVGIRGGIQNKSISVQTAFTQGKNQLGHLVLNTPYHFLRTLKNKSVSKISFFQNDDVAKGVILNLREFRGGVQGIQNANVVLIILESFSLEYMEKGYTPFLTELSKKSLFFGKHMANGRRSIEALPALLCGLPSLLDEPISKSSFQGNKFSCFPKTLKDAGYATAFFHGGSRGTMGFESYTLANGFDRYYSREDYPDPKDYDGTWGIFDGPYLNFASEKMDSLAEPFLTGIFTLSSHQPYVIPKDFKGKFPKGSLEIHESIGYVDHSLKTFFEKIKNKKWFKNTLFVITADHSQKLESEKFLNIVGQYRVPLIIYSPGFELEKKPSKVTQHSDIPKSILDFVEVRDDLPLTSVSVFSVDEGMAMNYASGNYLGVSGNTIIAMDKMGKQTFQYYDWESGQIKSGPAPGSLLLKAYVQYFINGLINNNLSL